MTEPQKDPFSEGKDAADQYDLLLIDAYLDSGLPVDMLAYTNEFDTIHAALEAAGDKRSKAEVFRRLLNLRKSGRLPRQNPGAED